jgi:hypothetical protein
MTLMDRTEITVRKMLTAVEAPLASFRCSSIATLASPISMSVLQVSIVSPCSTISTRPRSRGSRRMASILALSLKQVPATSRPTWSQTLRHHPHLHCLVSSDGLVNDHLGSVEA